METPKPIPLKNHVARLFKRLSGSFGIDLAHYGVNLTWYSIGHAATVLRSLVTSILLAYLLTRDELGQFRYVMALFGLVSVFGIPGLQTIAVLAAAKKEHGIIKDIIKTSLRWGIIGSIGLISWSLYKGLAGDTTVALSLLLAAGLLPFALYGNFGYPIMQGQEAAKSQNGLVIIHSLLVAGMTVLFALLKTGPIGITFAVIGTDALFRAWLTRRIVSTLPGDARSDALQAFSRSWNRIYLFQYFAGQLDQVILERAGGYGRLSTFYIATMGPDQFKDLYGNLSNILIPRLAKTERTYTYAKGLWRNVLKVLALCAVTIAFFILIAPYAIPFLFPKYPDAVFPSQIYMLSFIFFPTTIIQNYFQSKQLSRPLSAITIVNGTSTILLGITLIPFFGLWGAIFTRTIARLLTVSVASGLFLYELHILKKKQTVEPPLIKTTS